MEQEENKQTLEELKKIVAELKQTQSEMSASVTVPNSNYSLLRRPLRQLKKQAIILGIILLLVLFAFLFIKSTFLKEGTVVNTASSFAEQIQELSSLATSKAYMKAVVEQEDNELFGKKIDKNLPGTKRKVLVIIPGEVLAGVDLSNVTKNDIKINEEKRTIQLSLPKAEILQKPTLYFDEVQIFSSEGLFRGEASIDEGYTIAELAQDQIVNEAIAQGVLTSAEEQATTLIKKFINQLNYDVTIEFKE